MYKGGLSKGVPLYKKQTKAVSLLDFHRVHSVQAVDVEVNTCKQFEVPITKHLLSKNTCVCTVVHVILDRGSNTVH